MHYTLRNASLLAVALLSLVANGCRPDPSAAGTAVRNDATETAPDRNFEERVYERSVVFMTIGLDSTIIVPWFFTARGRPAGVVREVRGWLARSGEWEPFFQDRWEAPPTRAAFRILPRGAMRLVVGEGDALEAILFEEGARQLDVMIDEPVADWSGSRGEAFRVHDGSVLLGGQRVEGRLLDVNRAHRPGDLPPGDWIFLEGGPGVTIVLEAPIGVPPGATPHTGWGHLGEREVRWPRVDVRWRETRAFEPARRDVPIAWSISSADGDLQGALSTVTMQLTAGGGAGPILPVDGLFQVRGELTIEGETVAVRGVLRHIQP